MALDESAFARARKLEPRAIELLLASIYPAVHRIAHGLSGRGDVGDGVLAFIIKQSIHQLPRFRDPEAAERWFHHHTVLTIRRAHQYQPSSKSDTLVGPAGSDPQYAAFVRALRALPEQQREAFVLHHAERMPVRSVAISMDCSTHAAELHLRAAQDALGSLAGAAFESLKQRMAEVYSRLAPVEAVLRPALRRQISRTLFPRRLKRLCILVLVVALVIAVVWVAHHFQLLGRLGLPQASSNK
jgi:DNA-directed RNA polymerase specialized sigma24 family protein